MEQDTRELFINQELLDSYLRYAESIIKDRALADIRDGLKPVQRRIIYSMWNHGNRAGAKYKKSANIVGHVMGELHPHGDVPIYSSMVRMTQPFATNVPLVDGQGNFGSIDGDEAAAMRYTEVRLSAYSTEFFLDLHKETAEMKLNYDGSLLEPVYLPARVPNLLVNGVHGIAVGISTSIPPHNLGEICRALILLLKNPNASYEDIFNIVLGPDLPTGGIISNRINLQQVYRTGQGSMKIRAKYHFEDRSIVFTEIPYQSSKPEILLKIATLIGERKLNMCVSVRDESSQDGVRIIVRLSHHSNREIVANQILKMTNLQTTYRICFYAINEHGQPRIYSLMDYLRKFLKLREDILIKNKLAEIQRFRKRVYTLTGLLVVLQDLDQLITIIRNNSVENAKSLLKTREWPLGSMAEYKELFEITGDTYILSSEQIDSIMDLKLQQISKLEREALYQEIRDNVAKIQNNSAIAQNHDLRKEILIQDLQDIIQKHDHERRSVILDEGESSTPRDLIASEEIMILLTKDYGIHRRQLSSYQVQNRGGKGRNLQDDIIKSIVSNTRDHLMFFTDHGLAYSVDSYHIPENSNRAVVNFIALKEDEKILDMFSLSENTSKDLSFIFLFNDGKIRRNSVRDFLHIRSDGKKYIKDQEVEVLSVLLCEDKDYILIATKKGKAVLSPVSSFRVFGSRNSTGVRACKLAPGDSIAKAVSIHNIEDKILTITSNGWGKISSLSEYRVTNRGTQGVKNIKIKNDQEVIGIFVMRQNLNYDLILNTEKKTIRINLNNIRITGRNTGGVRLVDLVEQDKVLSAHLVEKDETSIE